MGHLVELADAGPEMIENVGGKAVNLGVLIRAGFPVPPGICLTTEAYRTVVGDTLDDLMDRVSADGPEVAGVAATARDRVRNATVPEGLRQEIVSGYRRLGSNVPGGSGGVPPGMDTVPVAVRSSATAEDLAYASFAGQQDSYLNVVGDDAVVEAVRRCWASLWTERAVSYRNANAHRPP